MTSFDGILDIVHAGGALTRDQMRRAIDLLLENSVNEEHVADFLLSLKKRGESVDEIVAAAQSVRAKALPVSAPAGVIDTCGTGGDGADTYNISTAAALIVAGCGVPVAKHGNKAVSSRSGSSDVLSALGVKLTDDPKVVERCICEAGVGFMFAAYHHRAFANVASVRKKLGVRTIFNLLGPLANPAGARRQLMGVYDRNLTAPLAAALGALGAEHAWVVAGADGLDELTTTGETYVSELKDGDVRQFSVTPEDAGIARAPAYALKGGDPQQNAAALRRLLEGEPGPYRDIAVLNAAGALIVSGKYENLRIAAEAAAASIDRGHAKASLDRLIANSNAVKE